MLPPDLLGLHVVVDDGRPVTVSAFDLGTDDGGDLLRRPGRPSTAAVAGGLSGQIEHVNLHLHVCHRALSRLNRLGPRHRRTYVCTPRIRGIALR